MIVVLDSNIWISIALSKRLELIELLYQDDVIIAGCKEMLNELLEVTLRSKFQKHFSKSYIELLLQLYNSKTKSFELADIKEIVQIKKTITYLLYAKQPMQII